MATRKLMQEVEKCYKKVAEGVDEFNSIYEKIEQSNNPAQKEKLEDNLKREIKKLQRLRDQIKTWAASSDVKDKDRLMDHRKLIETQMEKFKAVEKAMKTKAYSKEGLSGPIKLDPQEQKKMELCDFLSNQVDALEQLVEALEAESETLAAGMKKGKANKDKATRVAEIEQIIEKHKFHQGKLELIQRSLENGRIDPEQVVEVQDSIDYYVQECAQGGEPPDDDGMYDDLDLGDNEEVFGMNQDPDKPSSEDTRSIQDEPDQEVAKPSASKARAAQEPAALAGRRPSTQLKSPLPTLATLHQPIAVPSSSVPGSSTMKPASLPPRPVEGLKYSSAAAAGAASDKNLGIAPLPPPTSGTPVNVGINPLPPVQAARSSAASSPASALAQPATTAPSADPKPPPQQPVPPSSEPTPTPSSSSKAHPPPAATAQASKAEPKQSSRAAGKAPATDPPKGLSTKTTSSYVSGSQLTNAPAAPHVNGTAPAPNGIKAIHEDPEDEESTFHLPSCLDDLLESYELSRKRPPPVNSASALRLLAASQKSQPAPGDAEIPRSYRPDIRIMNTQSNFPESPLPIFDDPRLYGKIDPDTLFYVFYYKQGTHHQYLAAKALKDQSWRFHKQYQTWFQRHEEPKNITEEFEQGTYRFFDYESTW
jgi:CCR4-NOT transcription complex subunit 3